MIIKNNNVNLGKSGEDAALSYLRKNGYRILEKNYRNRIGEIDLIAKNDGTFCFIEVKTRGSDAFGTGLDAISRFKMKKISQVALSYLKEKRCMDVNARFDVLSICRDEQGVYTFDLIKNAFEVAS